MYKEKTMAYKGHISFGKQFLRAILGLFLSIGFGLFWVAMIYGIARFLLFFVIGCISILMGILHLIFVIKKQLRYRSY